MSYTITQLHCYPIKSMGGIQLQSAELTSIGFAYDRFWMLCEPYGQFITQREIPELALFKLAFANTGVQVTYKGESLLIPFDLTPNAQDELPVTIFGKEVRAQKERKEVNAWLSDQLGREVILVRRAAGERRAVNQHPEVEVAFSDSQQILVLGEASLAALNSRLIEPVPMNRFRPNIMFSDGNAHVEDSWILLRIGGAQFAATKNCGRCKITTVDQSTGVMGTEPLQTLATYRKEVRSVIFGRYLKVANFGNGKIEVGDEIEVLKKN